MHLCLSQPDREERLPEFNCLSVCDQAFDNLARGVSFDFVHQLHCFNDANNLTLFDVITRGDKGCSSGRR